MLPVLGLTAVQAVDIALCIEHGIQASGVELHGHDLARFDNPNAIAACRAE